MMVSAMKNVPFRPLGVTAVGLFLIALNNFSEDRYTWNGIDVDVMGYLFAGGGLIATIFMFWWQRSD